jgi:hypothetical protein
MSHIHCCDEVDPSTVCPDPSAHEARFTPAEALDVLTEIVAAYTDGDWQSFGRLIESAAMLLNRTPVAILRSPESDRVEAFAEGLARSDGTVTGGDSFTHRLRSPESDRCTRARHDEHCADLHWDSGS